MLLAALWVGAFPVHSRGPLCPSSLVLLKIVSCGCKTGCKTALCSCVKFNLACSEFCKCMQANCQNPMKAAASDGDDSDEEFDEEFEELA